MAAPALAILFIGRQLPAAFRKSGARLVSGLDEALAQVASGGFAVAVADALALAPLEHSAAKLAEASPETALVIWTSRTREAEALAAVNFGATDYLLAEETKTADLMPFLATAAARRRAERRFATKAARTSRRQPTPDTWLWETDPQFRFAWFSARFRNRAGLDTGPAHGRAPWDLDRFSQSDEFWDHLRADLAGHRPVRDVLFGLTDEQGNPQAFRISGEARFDADGTFLGYAGHGTDVTREVQHSLRLAQVHERLMDTYDTLEAFRNRVAEDLRASRAMQEELLPRPEDVRAIEQRYGVTIEAHFETSSELGGDIWGVRPIDDSRFALYITDFSGHGVAAALNTFRLHTVLENMVHGMENPGGYMQALNQRMATLLPTGQYATMFYGVVDVRASRLFFAAAASPRPLLADPAGKVMAADGSGLPLGVTSKVTYETREIAFPPGGLLFLYSDALLECGREKGMALGKQGVADLLQDAVRHHGCDVPLQSVLAPFFARVSPPLSDDLTAVRCFRRRG